MIKVKGIALYVVLRGYVGKRHRDALNALEPPALRHECDPSLNLVCQCALKILLSRVQHEQEEKLDFIGIPRRGRANPDFTQRPQYTPLPGLLIVAFSKPELKSPSALNEVVRKCDA